MLARDCVYAFISQHQASNRETIQDVRFNDFGDVFRLYSAIPNRLGIDNYGWAVLTLVKAAGLIGTHSAFQTPFRNGRLKELLQVPFGALGARSPGTAGLTLIGTDEDMLLEFGHKSIVQEDREYRP